MNYIFFLFGILAIIWEFISFTDSKKVFTFTQQLKKDIKTSKYDELNPTQRTLAMLMFFYLLWAVIGLFTEQWVLFLLLLLLSIIPKKYMWYSIIDSIFSVIVIITSMLNEFHLHIDLWSELLKLLK